MTPARLLDRTRHSPANRGAAVLALLLLLSGCTADAEPPSPPRPPAPGAPAFRLVAFDSCAEALAGLKAAAQTAVGPWGLGEWAVPFAARAEGGLAADQAAAPASGVGRRDETPAFSGTNTHESGVDEPDLVKTDGRRIVTVSRGVLRVVDAATRRVTGRIELAAPDSPERYVEMSLLLHGDRALVLVPASWAYGVPEPVADLPIHPRGTGGSQLLLVDLSGSPRIVSRYRTDGALVDARQVGGTARVVVRAHPRIDFPQQHGGTDAQRIAANRKAIDSASLADWLPRYEVITAGRTETGHVPCERLAHPPAYSGASLLSLLTFDLAAPALGSGDAVTVAADGDTVYGTATSVYVASDRRWAHPMPVERPQVSPARPVEPTTQIHRFDLTASGPPRYVASGEVPGWLVNQYALSEWQGHLRVATTSGPEWLAQRDRVSSSAVYVLQIPEVAGDSVRELREVGRVTGLGRDERIYAVRFLGDTGYVVTFRQTDPLYSLDLHNPARPRVTGELKINGYSAYLHQVGAGRLLGIGQDADARGRVTGSQVSLFDVSDPARPVRLAAHRIAGAHSEAEFDPHAFLYWPPERLLVVPMSSPSGMATEALALRVGDRALDEAGRVRHPVPETARAMNTNLIRRSLVVGDTLWTLSDAGLLASRVTDLGSLGWVPLT